MNIPNKNIRSLILGLILLYVLWYSLFSILSSNSFNCSWDILKLGLSSWPMKTPSPKKSKIKKNINILRIAINYCM